MKLLNGIVNRKVLIIYKCNGPAGWHRDYCGYKIGKIVEYNIENNTVNIEDKKKNIKTFNIIDKKDPFNLNIIEKNDNRFAYYISKDGKTREWESAFIFNNALTILRNNIKQSHSQYVYKLFCLSSFSYGRKTKKRFLRDLLNELEKDYQ